MRRTHWKSLTIATGALGLVLVGVLWVANAAELISRETDSGTIVGYKDTPLLPSTGNKYHVHDPDRPAPKIVVPGPPKSTAAPSDAIALFDGKDLSKWQASDWKIEDGQLVAGHGSIVTADAFGDCQLHIGWMTPTTPSDFMNRGNSGVILMGQYEIQIFDSHSSHEQQIYPDGQAASIYGQTPPLVNACRAPGEWQSFDIVFIAPVFEDDKLKKPGRVTVLHNGVLVHHDQEIMGPMTHAQILPYKPHAAKLPLTLQGHGSPVRFRDVWIRPLDK